MKNIHLSIIFSQCCKWNITLILQMRKVNEWLTEYAEVMEFKPGTLNSEAQALFPLNQSAYAVIRVCCAVCSKIVLDWQTHSSILTLPPTSCVTLAKSFGLTKLLLL